MNTYSLAGMPATRPEILLREEGNDFLLFDTRTGAIFIINPSAAEIWKLCDGTRTLQTIITELTGRYPSRRTKMPGDVSRFIARALKADIMTREQTPRAKAIGPKAPRNRAHH